MIHERLGATMTSFAGWQMPLRYASETAEHHAVRRAAGLFDLSHMGEIMVTGPGAGAALDYALTGHLSVVPPGRARYTMICAPDGGVLDDLVVYRQGEQDYLVIANASNTGVVLAQLAERSAGYDATVADATSDYALIAVQGPQAAGILAPLTEVELGGMKYYTGAFGEVAGRPAGLRVPGTPARTASSCSAARRTPSMYGPRWRRRALQPAWSPRAWRPAIRSGWRPGCRCTATNSAPM